MQYCVLLEYARAILHSVVVIRVIIFNKQHYAIQIVSNNSTLEVVRIFNAIYSDPVYSIGVYNDFGTCNTYKRISIHKIQFMNI